MTAVVPTSANEFIEQQLDARLLALEQAFQADGLSLIGPLYGGLDDLVRSMVDHLRVRETRRKRLLVLLTTAGGYLDPVQRIVDTFRHYYQHVSFIIPNYAYSAGTVLVMSGDDIYMDYYSRLGPIDPQVPSARGRQVPALGYLRQWERLLGRAQSGTLTTAELQLMLVGFDQAELYEYEQARELSISLLKEWLVKYKFKDWTVTETHQRPVTDADRQQRAEEIARELNNTDRWHSHGYGISMEVLRRDLNLRIDDLDATPDRCGMVKQYDGLLTDYAQKLGQARMLHAVGKFLQYA